MNLDLTHTIASRLIQHSLHTDAFWTAHVAILDRYMLNAVTARLADDGLVGWSPGRR